MIKKSVCLIAAIFLTIVFCIYAQEKKKVIPLTTKSGEALKYYEKALRAFNQAYAKEAVENFKKAIKIDTEFVMARAWYSFYLAAPDNQQMIDEAKKYFDKVTEGEKMFALAMEAQIQNDNTKAIEILEELKAKYPDDGLIHIRLYYIFYLEKEYQKAIEAGKKAIACDPHIYAAYNFLGYIYIQIGMFDEAVKWLRQYAEFLPDSANPLDSLGDAYRHAGKYKEAWECYQKALKIKPDFNPALRHLGDVKHELGYYEEAVPYYKAVLKTLLPLKETSELYYKTLDTLERIKLVNNYIYMGEIDKAAEEVTEEFFYAEEMEEIISLKNHREEELDTILLYNLAIGNIIGHYFSAEIALKRKDMQRAKEEADLVQKLIKENNLYNQEKNQIANFLRAKIHLAEEDLTSAEKFALAAVNAFPQEGRASALNLIYTLGNDRKICVEPLNLLAEIRRKQNKVSDEIQVINKSLELIPHQPKLHYRLGEIYAQQNKKEKAAESFKKYLGFCEYFNCSGEAKQKAEQFITKYSIVFKYLEKVSFNLNLAGNLCNIV